MAHIIDAGAGESTLVDDLIERGYGNLCALDVSATALDVAKARLGGRAVKPGGHVVVATFGPEGPTRCSGLEIVRCDPESLHDEFGPAFRLVDHRSELHRTPMGTTQQFTYCYCVVSPEA